MDSPKIPEGLQTFLAHAESLHPSGNSKRENGFAKEFQQLKALSSQLKKNPEYISHHGEMECNRPKNRYKDIVPFDYNRAILPTIPGVPGSDYINGNYIKGPDGSTAYLAMQGPLPRTVDDFWRLIASHRCQVVIMVCKEIEMGKLKCKRYWPESKDEKMNFAGLQISLISEDDIAEGFVMRTINMKSDKDEMIVTQLQYTAWPDHDVPKSAAPLIEMNKTLRALQGNRKQQILIHCSAGCGRTGTICAVDYAWTLLKMQKTNNFSVYDIVADLRRQRIAMVQTKEQYALVYKAVVQLVQEELEKEKFKCHTYVNVELPGSPQSPTGHSNYENCDFIKSVDRWKQSDMQNGSVPRRPLSLPLPVPAERKADPKPLPSKRGATPPSPKGMVAKPVTAERKTDPKPSSSNRAPLPTPSPEGMVVSSERKGSKDYVNLEFAKSIDPGKKLSPTESKPVISTKPTVPYKDYAVKRGAQSPTGGQKKPPTFPDYEVLPGPSLSPPMLNTANNTAVQRNKGSLSDYEIPPLAAQGGKKQTRHVPEGLLIDLGDDVSPVPTKRHSVGSSRYENTEVKSQSPPGVTPQRATSSPNVLDDMFLLSDRGFKPQVMQPQNSISDSRGFHTVPNRQKVSSGPKRCPLTAEAFEDPHAIVKGGFKVVQSPTEASGQYSLVGAVSNPSPPKATQNPALVPHPNPGTGLQMTMVNGVPMTPLRKQGEKPKARTPVGAYSLVGIPETGSQMPIHVESIPMKAKSDLKRQSNGSAVEVQNTGVSVQAKNVGVPVQAKNVGVPVQAKNAGGPAEVKSSSPIAEPSYELVGQWVQPVKKVPSPVVQPYKPKTEIDANKGAKGPLQSSPHSQPKVDKKRTSVESNSSPDVFLSGQGDGDAINEVVVGTDIYATVGIRSNDQRNSKGSSSPNLSAKAVGSSPKLRDQTSSGSLQSFTSTSSDEGEAPPIPQKTNDAFIAPGEEPYESVQQQHNKGTLDRVKKIIKTGAKISLPKRLSDVTTSHGLPRSNSSGSGVTLQPDDVGYKKRVPHPKGPRSCPRHWPQLNL